MCRERQEALNNWAIRWKGPTAIGELFVQPDILVAVTVENAVDHERDTLDVGVPAGPSAGIEDDRPCDIFRQLAFNLPDLVAATLLVALHRLQLDHLVDLGIAVIIPVQARSAPVEHVEDRIRIGTAGL